MTTSMVMAPTNETDIAGGRPLDAEAIPASVCRWIRRLSHYWSIAVPFGFLVWRILLGVPQLGEEGYFVVMAQVGLVTLYVVAALAAWKWEIQGATVMAALAAGLAVWIAYDHPLRVAQLVLLLFAAPAFGFWLIWQRTKPLWEITALGTVLVVILGASAYTTVQVNDYFLGPQHPQSDIAAPPKSNVEWVWSGGVTVDEAVVTARLRGAGEARLAVTESEDFDEAIFVEGEQAGTPEMWRFDLDGLDPGTDYRYAVEQEGELDTVRAGEFSTHESGAHSFRVIAGSCARNGSNGAVFDTIREMDPDLFLITGDLHYSDIATNDRGRFRQAYDQQLGESAPAALYRSAPVAYIWDDHDYGPNDADSTANSRPAAQTVYREVVPHYELAAGEGQRPIYQAFTIGRVRFIVTDGRSAKSPAKDPDDADKTMLGAEQLAWFENELLVADEEYPVVVWVNNVPWIAPEAEGSDNWAGYTTERAEIADFIADNDIDGLFMIAGDAHMVAIDDGTNSDYSASGGAGFPVLHAAALDRPGSEKGGPYSGGAFPGAGQFGVVDIADDGGDEIGISLSGMSYTGDEIVRYDYTVLTDAP